MRKPKIIALVGPTASGKTSLGIYLAQKIGGEVISADSRQVYKGLDIGTGKVTKEEMAGVPHHLLDVASPMDQYTVDDFCKQATQALGLIYQNNHIPLLVGGTGLYVDTFLGRMSYAQVPPNPALRTQLETASTEELFERLYTLDPRRAGTIEKENPRRLVRAIEIAEAIGQSPLPTQESTYDILWIGLAPDTDTLHANIRARLHSRIQEGMIEEAERLHMHPPAGGGLSYARMDELGLEYRFLARLLQQKISKEEFVVELERAIQQYAKRQMRWFKRNKDIHWVNNKEEALTLATEFLK